MPKTDWEKKLEKATKNIGFITRSNAFSEPTAAEKARALAIETESWQRTQKSGWKSSWKVSAPYAVAKGAGTNLRATRRCGEPLGKNRRDRAITAFVNTPMDKDGVLKSLGINVKQYEKPKTLFGKIYDWFKRVIFKKKKQLTRSYMQLQNYLTELEKK